MLFTETKESGGAFTVLSEAWLKSHPDHNLLFAGMGCQGVGFQSYAEMKGWKTQIIQYHFSMIGGLQHEYAF